MDVMAQSQPLLDRALIGRIIRDEIPRHRNIRTVSGLSHEARMSRSKIYEVLEGAPNTSQNTFRRIEGAFDWPSETLTYVGLRDLAALTELGAPLSVIASVRKDLDNIAGPGGRVVGGEA